jgi:phage tail sheath protein FI
MPEYLAPGVYVEEISFRSKSIEGVGTTTTGFVGPTRYGPVDLQPDVITSITEFERTYGDAQPLLYGSTVLPNFMWHAARAFFENHGVRLYVSRVFAKFDSAPEGKNADGRATYVINGAAGAKVNLTARFPGEAGNMHVRITLTLGPNVLGQDTVNGKTVARARGLLENDIVVIAGPPLTSPLGDLTFPVASSPLNSPLGGSPIFARAESYFDATAGESTWKFIGTTGGVTLLNQLKPDPDPAVSDEIRVVNLTVTVYPPDPSLPSWVYSGLALDLDHETNGKKDSVTAHFAEKPDSLAEARTIPIIITTENIPDGLSLLTTLLTGSLTIQPGVPLQHNLLNTKSSDSQRSLDVELAGGNDGKRPTFAEYEGNGDPEATTKTGLVAFEDIDEVAIVAAPGSTYGFQNGYRDDASTIISLLIAHAERMRYRIAVLDSGDGQGIADVRAMRAKFDSSYAAFYFPWVTILDPVSHKEINLPPSGFVTGIYARNDINRAVYKAPANEVVTLALGFETTLNKAQQDVLNPLGINCFRSFEDRGLRLWGARTISSDPEWKYVNLRRYFAYLEHSIDKGTQWAVFEPNGDALWANVRRTISDFLLNEWQNGALLGDKPEKAYFVRCDRTTMTQNDLDNGRLVCLIGVAPLRPAEFVIFRIGQWTADAK